MPTITAIQSSSRDPLRCRVKTGREVVARLSRDSVERLGLTVGVTWDEALAARVRSAEQRDAARRDALKLLRRRAIGSAELAERLKSKGHGEDPVRGVVARLVEQGLLDDEQYGRLVIRAEMARKPTGRRLLQQKLYRKRLPRDLIERLVDESGKSTDAVADARKLIEKKMRGPTLQRCDPLTRKRRLWSALARRGFDPDTINAAMRDATP